MEVKMNDVSNEVKKSMKQRIITAFFIALIGIPCLLVGSWLYLIIVLFISGVATYEILHSAKKERFPILFIIFEFVMMFSFIFWVFTDKKIVDWSSLNNNLFGNIYMLDIRVSTLGLAFYIALLFTFVISNEKIDVKDACYVFAMSLIVSISVQSAMFLRYSPEVLYNKVIIQKHNLNTLEFYYSSDIQQSFLLIFVLGGALICDGYAYFVGVLFGKHKMNPRISPKKTWEGFVGGLVLTAITLVSFCFICDANNAPVLKGILDLEHWYYVIFFSILIPIVSVLGDLMFSSIKRYYCIKDFGNMLPGHGGVLDRFDSVLITSLVVSVFILFIAYLPFSF